MPATKSHPAYTIHKDGIDYLSGWIKKTTTKPVTFAKISAKMVNPRDIAGERKSKRMVNLRDIVWKAEEEKW